MTEIPNQSFRMPTSDAKPYLEQASALMNIGHFQEAIPLYESALAALERTYGADQPELAECLQELGDAYEAGYRLTDALAIHIRLLRLGEKVLGQTNPNVVAMRFKLTQLNEMLGRPADALAFCQQALESAQQCMSEDDPLSRQIIDRYRYLTTLMEAQAHTETQAYNEAQLSDPALTPDWQAEIALPEAGNGDISQPTNMQDFAREMLKDMPVGQRPFSQTLNAESLSSSHNPVQSAPPGQALNTVPSTKAAEQNNYKSILEAGYSAAQSHSSHMALPHDPYAGVSGSPPPPPPAYEPGGEGYSSTDLDDIVPGRRNSGEMYSKNNVAKPRRISTDDHNRIVLARRAKDLALPVFGVLILVGLLIFIMASNKGTAPKTEVSAQDLTKTALYGQYRTSDGEKEVRLVSGNTALFVTAGSATEVPYAQISSNWGDLFSAMTSSLTEKQIWAEKKNLGLKTQDEIVYYATEGAEAKVIAKMRHLAGYAQNYFLKQGEYPKYVNQNMTDEFSFVSPVDGRNSPIQIRTLLSQTSDGADVRGGLESGLEAGLVSESEAMLPASGPCYITCYAVVIGKPDENVDKQRATQFFVRGCDRNGNFLASGQSGRTYVVPASNSYLSELPAGALGNGAKGASSASRSKISSRTKSKGRIKVAPKAAADSADTGGNDDQDQPKAAKPALPAVQVEKPVKATKLWLITNPAYPMVLMHHAVPLILLGLAALAILQARMANAKPTGPLISSTPNTGAQYAQIAAAVLLALAVLAMAAQFIIFA